MKTDVSFGKADAGAQDDSDDASQEGVEELRQEVCELRQELRDERLARKQAESEIESLREEMERLRESIENGGEGEMDVVEIEWKARNQDYRDMTANVERAVRIWEAMPNHSSTPRDKLTMTYDELKRAISKVDSRPKKEVNSNTVKRVRTKLRELSDSLVVVNRKEGMDKRKRDRVVVSVHDWAEHREDAAVRGLLPERVADAVLGGDDD